VHIPPARRKKILPADVVVFVVAVALAYGGYGFWNIKKENTALRGRVSELQNDITGLESSLSASRADLAQASIENSTLTEELRSEQNRNNNFEAQINNLSGTVGTLKKLSETDPELLKKYSKTYFLSENYAPAQLSSIDTLYLYDQKHPQLIIPGVLSYLEAMFASAGRDGVELRVVSAYRSFYEQVSLKLGYKMTYGTGANKFSADQGYSEHQLGTAVDLAAKEMSNPFSQFDGSAAQKWLTDHAYQFGFILSYPKDNSYYQYEPWHWRFVGVTLAAKLHNTNEYFYNMAQRDIDAHLVSFFD
jgi:LAS superfamily LD-carboxypeptidase LdcB